MATITTILGTDSVSSSRVTLNDNFAAINQELADIAALLDVLNETITLSGLAKFGSLNIANGKVIANSSSLTSTVPVTINEKLNIGRGVYHSVTTGVTTLPTAGNFTSSTYVLNGSGISGTLALAAGLSGQEITLIADGGPIAVAVTNVNGPSSISIANKGTLTLRFVGTKWSVIGSYGVTF
jgi:hypothetical protein